MNRLLIIFIALIFSVQGFAQEAGLSKREIRKYQKEMKKERKAEEAAKRAELISLMVEYQRFVLEADRLRDRRGNTANVSSMINYIANDSINGVIQIGSDRYVGLNGVGGITLEGPVSNYEYKLDQKSGSYNVSYIVRSATGTYDVRMTVFPDGRADATITSNWPGRLNYLGYLVPPSQSKVYKGRTTF
jgi:hypothetical protein